MNKIKKIDKYGRMTNLSAFQKDISKMKKCLCSLFLAHSLVNRFGSLNFHLLTRKDPFNSSQLRVRCVLPALYHHNIAAL